MSISHQLQCRVSGASHTTLIPTLVVATAVVVALVVASPLVQAQTYTVLYDLPVDQTEQPHMPVWLRMQRAISMGLPGQVGVASALFID